MPTFFLTECPGLQTSVLAADTIGNTTTATAFGSSFTWGASSMSVVGRSVRVQARGLYGTTSTGGRSFSLEVMIGTTALLTTGVIAPTLAGGTSKGWYLSAQIGCRTAGAAGALEAQGLLILGTSTLAPDVAFMANTATVNFDLTTSANLVPRVTWSTADASNVIQMRMLSEEIMGTS